MNETTQFLMRHGLPLVFAAVLVEQMGLPIPAVPLLLTVGALAATGKFSLVLGILVTVLACLIADISWFYLGRYRGNKVLRFLCRLSLEPDSCVRRTQNLFTRYGLRGLVFVKFVPGMSTVSAPLAGMSGINAVRFLFFDLFGSLLYGAVYLSLGYLFSNQIEIIASALADIGGNALTLLAVIVGGYIGYKYWQRRRLLRELRMARITVAELRRKQESGEQLVILDLRSNATMQSEPELIQGAIHVDVEDIPKRRDEFPRDRDIIVYCSCPNEATAARVALLLQRQGFRVRPLLGGIDAWREQNFPLAPQAIVAAAPTTDKSAPQPDQSATGLAPQAPATKLDI